MIDIANSVDYRDRNDDETEASTDAVDSAESGAVVGLEKRAEEVPADEPAEIGVAPGHPTRVWGDRFWRGASPAQRFSADWYGRLRIIIGSLVGTGSLLLSQLLRPDEASVFGPPADVSQWAALTFGCLGVWLVPGLWLSGLVIRTGAGLPAWLGTRIATTLCWYAAVGPVIHFMGEGARVTTAGILIATIAVTAAAVLGLVLGMSRWPGHRWQRVVALAFIGAVCAQVAISLSMRMWTYDMNYTHIRRLSWLIVLGGALIATVGDLCTPKLPPIRTLRSLRIISVFVLVFAMTGVALHVVGGKWSPQQQMPSAFAIEQRAAPSDVDLKLVLTPIGEAGPSMVRDAVFTVTDSWGRPVAATVEQLPGDGEGVEELLVAVPTASRTDLCVPGGNAKITVRDQMSGVRVQATLPDVECPE